MRSKTNVPLTFLFGVLVFGLGVWTGTSPQPQTVEAQTLPMDRFELQSGQMGGVSFYAVKMDRQTGETWVLSARGGAGDDRWMLLPVIDKRQD